MVAKFLAVTAEANAMWADEANRAKMLPVIAKDAGMSEEDTASTMDTFVFPTVEDQLSAKWLGGGVAEFMSGAAAVFVEAGAIPSALDSYAGAQAKDLCPHLDARTTQQCRRGASCRVFRFKAFPCASIFRTEATYRRCRTFRLT